MVASMAHIEDHEKAVLGPNDFTGIELDTRSPSERGECYDTEKPLPFTPQRSYQYGMNRYAEMGHNSEIPSKRHEYESYSGAITRFSTAEKVFVPEDGDFLHVKQTKTNSKRKLKIIIAISILLVVAAIAAVLGGVLGSRKNDNSEDSSSPPASTAIPSPTASPKQINDELPAEDVMVGSSLVPISFSVGPEDKVPGSTPGRNTHLFYQNAGAGIKQIVRQGNDWSGMKNPLWTDAIKNTGLAAINYVNGTSHETSVFYVSKGPTVELREKRLHPNEVEGQTWNLGTLQKQNYTLGGQPGFDDDTSVQNAWAGFRMTAVYSANFSSGAGARLFYHASNESTQWIQELIWRQDNDSWSKGTQLLGASPSSHLGAVIDEPTQALRLFYISSDTTLSESYLNITDPESTWQSGIQLPNLLNSSSSDFSLIATDSDTILYYTAATSAESNITIRELILPASMAKADSISLSSQVATPALLAKNTDSKLHSQYAPIGATFSPPFNDDEEAVITVFWAEDVQAVQSGYGALKSLTRTMNVAWDERKTVSLPLEID